MKSNERNRASDYLELVEAIYKDATTKCIADVSDLRDLTTVKSRVENEGISFLTITLPQFCKDFERSLANGRIDSTLFARFRRVKRGLIPAFLQGLTSRIFNRETGEIILNENNSPKSELSSDIPTIVEAIRQICLTFKKAELECTPARTRAALASFVKIEQSFDSFSVPDEELVKFRQVSSLLWDHLFVDFSTSKCTPKHGPGATAEHISGNRKYVWQYWYDRLEPYFPLVGNGFPIGIYPGDMELENVTIVPVADELPVRVVTVPKTLKGPRTIAIEPCCMQYVQQGLRDYLYRKLGSYSLTAGQLNFVDQGINQRLAIEGSISGQLATIDLKDASDRVPRSLALEMFRGNPDLRDAIDACRSTMAQMPDGSLVGPLRKFASMGSALCFPVEAMYFYTVCVVALLEDASLSYTLDNISNVVRVLYIYGDDIIVPSMNATIVLDYLQKYNCKVNVDKTFVSGSFRESCGVDAYMGYQVTPVYIHAEYPKNKQHASQYLSLVASANLFYKKGYWNTTKLLFNKLERIMGYIPYVSDDSEAVGRFSFLGCETTGRWNRDLQRLEIRAFVPRPVRRTDVLENYGALTKCFLGKDDGSVKNAGRPLTWTYGPDKDLLPSPVECSKLERTALRGAVTLKRRWVTPH